MYTYIHICTHTYVYVYMFICVIYTYVWLYRAEPYGHGDHGLRAKPHVYYVYTHVL